MKKQARTNKKESSLAGIKHRAQEKKKQKGKKKELEYEFIFSAANNQKIVLQRYAEESVVWWNQGKCKKVWTGEVAFCEASDFVKDKWPKGRIIYSNTSYNPPARPTDVYP